MNLVVIIQTQGVMKDRVLNVVMKRQKISVHRGNSEDLW